MKEVTSYQCEQTGQVFPTEREARNCEFVALLTKAFSNVPQTGDVSQLVSYVTSGVYPGAPDAMAEAFKYFLDHRPEIELPLPPDPEPAHNLPAESQAEPQTEPAS